MVKELLKTYKFRMVLIGLSILGYEKNHPNDEAEQKGNYDLQQTVRLMTAMVSPVILPMIAVMGDDLSDIID